MVSGIVWFISNLSVSSDDHLHTPGKGSSKQILQGMSVFYVCSPPDGARDLFVGIFALLLNRHQIWKYLQSHLSGLDSFFLFCRWTILWIPNRWGPIVITPKKYQKYFLHLTTWNECSDMTGWWTFMCNQVTPLTIPTSNLWLRANWVNTDTGANVEHCRFKFLLSELVWERAEQRK